MLGRWGPDPSLQILVTPSRGFEGCELLLGAPDCLLGCHDTSPGREQQIVLAGLYTSHHVSTRFNQFTWK